MSYNPSLYIGYPVVNDPLYNHEVFGPTKGRGGDIGGKTDEQLVRDLINIHNAENWLGIDGDSELSLFKPMKGDSDDGLGVLASKGEHSHHIFLQHAYVSYFGTNIIHTSIYQNDACDPMQIYVYACRVHVNFMGSSSAYLIYGYIYFWVRGVLCKLHILREHTHISVD